MSDVSCFHHNATPLELFRERHWESYSKVVHGCCDALSAVWTELGVHSSDMNNELDSITANVIHVWQSAVATAESQKETFRKRIHEVEAEIRSIKAQLGDRTDDIIASDEATMTLKQRLDHTESMKNRALGMKQQRIGEFKDVLGKINSVRWQFGQDDEQQIDFENDNYKMTKADLDFMKCELERFCAERTRRMMRLETLWRPLIGICSELDENPIAIAKTVHPSLEFVEESFSSMDAMFSFERLPSLSEATFSSLEEKIAILTDERSNREHELQRMRETLFSLWDALQTSSDDLDRGILTRLMEGPARFHRRTFEKVTEEIHRQETTKARILKELVGQKIGEIQTVCDSGHLPLPKEVQQFAEEERTSDVTNLGHYADALARLTRMLTEVTLLVEKRSDILTMIRDLESARSEAEWLNAYEKDGGRYKGRNSNRKLQRALGAGKMRDKVPAMVNKLKKVLLEWERSEHQPFIYNGVDYRTQSLENCQPTSQLPPKSGRDDKTTPRTTGRRSAIPEYSTPSKSARGASKHRMMPQPNSKSACFREGNSMRSRPQTSAGHYPSTENEYGHLFKNAKTDYHPLQERLDQLLGTGPMTPSTVPNMHRATKSGIPTTPPDQSPHKETASCQSASSMKPSIQGSSEDEEMLDTVQVSGKPERTMPTPRLNLSALNKDIPSAGRTSSLPNSSQRRTTF